VNTCRRLSDIALLLNVPMSVCALAAVDQPVVTLIAPCRGAAIEVLARSVSIWSASENQTGMPVRATGAPRLMDRLL
jgi:hypothetical protein